ncbi:MAG: GH92 family glycosyl hydrolase [Chloroflexota bacterium]
MTRPVDFVNPLIDTANRRFFFFSSACRPFGMVNLSPDTVNGGAWGSGYRYDHETVLWFSHVHAWQLAGIPVLPTTGPVQGHLGAEVYKSRFSHEKETVRPGYHALFLDDYQVQAELTSTTRVGFHRYTFPEEAEGDSIPTILFDLGAEVGPSQMSDCQIEKVTSRELVGYVENAPTIRRPKPTRIYFVIQLDQDFNQVGGWRDGELLGAIEQLDGPGIGAYIQFAPNQETHTQDARKPGRIIQMKVAISYCGKEQARLNLDHELSHWDFDKVRAEADEEWNEWLGRIEVTGGSQAQRIKFYTDLYHALLGRRRVSDVDGKYIDNTGDQPLIRQVPLTVQGSPLYEHHNSDAFWGAQWTINVLWPLVCPEITHNFCNTFVDMYKNGGLIPRGPSGGNYTFVMIAPTSTPLLVSAFQKGIRNFDVDAAYKGMIKNHDQAGGLMSKAGYEHDTCIGGGLEYYKDRGYVPTGIQARAYHTQGGTQTLEYAYCDWALGQMAEVRSNTHDADILNHRAGFYEKLFLPEWTSEGQNGFLRPRSKDGSWPAEYDPMSPEGWVESNGWQNMWNVPHDVAGLIKLLGGRNTERDEKSGRERFVERLNWVFEKASEADFLAPHGKHHTNYLDYGNQPSTFVAHLFNYAGAPWLSQKWVRRVMAQAKSDITPYGGYGGDEDQGQMGALNVLMAIGLFNVSGGCNIEPFYEITTPIFDTITIHLNPTYYPGKRFTITCQNQDPENVYIQSAVLNGQSLERPWFYHKELAQGGQLELVLGPKPNYEWGSQPEHAPPSMSGSHQEAPNNRIHPE